MNWQFQSFEMSAKFHLYPVAKGAIWLVEYVSVELTKKWSATANNG